MDNAAFHKSSATARLIEQAGATLLFLSPYSADFVSLRQARLTPFTEGPMSRDVLIELFVKGLKSAR